VTTGGTALDMILEAAGRFPEHVAIEEADGSRVTYRELLSRARRATPTASIALLDAARTADFVAGCLGAWLAGRAWLPIDRGEPAARRQSMLALVEHDLPAALAYVIPTSGSSGTPKLVMVGHRGVPALLRSQIAAFELGPGARSLWLHAPIFDASVSDWGTALASGATLVVPGAAALASPSALRAELSERAITHVDLPPSLLPHLGDPPPALRVVVLGGEPCPVDRICALARRLRVVVVYGPTEATVCSSLVVVDPERWTRPLIGAPLPGVRYDVVESELWIAGDALAFGYAGDPAETARRFVTRDGMRWYRTGDRVEPGPPGDLAFAGRLDRQCKLAGRRVELDEIEAFLHRMPGVREAAVAIRSLHPAGRPVLVAFVDVDRAAAEVRAWMAAEAPAWMVPSRVVLGPLPRTATAKPDRARLASCALPAITLASTDVVERELASLWCDLLGLALDSRDQRFRDAGGDSLASLTLHAATAARGFAIDAALLAANPTFAELAAGARASPAATALVVETCEERGLAVARPPTGHGVRPQIRWADTSNDGGRSINVARGAVLMTGATGLLGPHLLRAWRARDRRGLIALVRAPDETAARTRVCAMGRDDDPGRDDLEVVCGDVARPELGLTRERWEALVERVGTVVHAAAKIDLAGDWDAHEAVNVGGTAEISRFVAAKPGIAWHHISTLSVFVNTDRATGRHEERTRPVREARVFGGYAQTKVAAEAIARAHGATSILRLGLLVGGERDANSQLAMTIRGLARLGAIPAGAEMLRFDLSPVEQVAASIVERALAAEGANTAGAPAIHHLADTRGATLGELVAAMRAHAVALDEVTPKRFAELASERIADPEIAIAYLALGRVHDTSERMRSFDLFLATGADFAVERGWQTDGELTRIVREALA
jgi:thioester reductase-like protein/acyl-CoA synthetase (AMP-forming)/AMP-acid ligase II